MRGKSIKIYLMDGIATGRWICDLSNWTGKAYKIPRTYYKKCSDRPELHNPAVYFLFGTDDDSGRPVVYIGETEDAYQRLGEHMKNENKSYWTEAIVFISKDSHFNKAYIKYLESRFYEIAKEVERYTVMNSQPPKKSAIAEDEEDEMEEFIDNVKIIVPALGYKVFEPLRSQVSIDDSAPTDKEPDEYLYIQNRNGISAKGFQSAEGFVVCKGSNIRPEISVKSVGKNIIKLREQYIADGTIQNNEFVRDTLFGSPSAASDFILGNSTSGPREWKNKDGKILKEI